jgi:hypothetical protein
VIFQDINTIISAGAVDGNIKVWDLRKNYSTIRTGPLPYHVFPYPASGTRKHGENKLKMSALIKLETRTVKAMLHGAIFLATCNAILLLRDVKLPNTSLHYTPPQNKDIQKCIFLLKVRKGFFQSAMFLASALKRGSHPPENILKI